ncbi:MAG TPA: amidohydrolase [Pirellulaceae bacterium]|jgi:hippurate hydrolase
MKSKSIRPLTCYLLALVLATLADLAAAPIRAAEQASAQLAAKVRELVDRDEKRLTEIFLDLHQHPELGFQEVRTAALVAKEFQNLGYETYTGIGKTGVVGILKNGPGPVIMFRSDMDALPVLEETGLPYASRATGTSASGSLTPVMHACGHDAHVVFLIGVAKIMKELKSDWSGTLVLIAQPAEELIEGARAMVQGGLYDKAPPPDVLIASHVTPQHPTGAASVKAGRRNAGTDQIDVLITGVGGHGSAPQSAKDPITMGALAIVSYQALVSQSIDPQEPSVLTVGSFQAGNANNVIPDTATLKVNIRWFEPKVREKLINGIKRVTDAIAVAADVPPEKMPKYIMKGSAGPLINDEAAVKRAEPAIRLALGDENAVPGLPTAMGSEDFQDLASPHPTTKILHVRIGCGPVDVVEQIKKGNPPPPGHNSKFKCELPTIAAGTKADAMVLLEFLKKP